MAAKAAKVLRQHRPAVKELPLFLGGGAFHVRNVAKRPGRYQLLRELRAFPKELHGRSSLEVEASKLERCLPVLELDGRPKRDFPPVEREPRLGKARGLQGKDISAIFRHVEEPGPGRLEASRRDSRMNGVTRLSEEPRERLRSRYRGSAIQRPEEGHESRLQG